MRNKRNVAFAGGGIVTALAMLVLAPRPLDQPAALDDLASSRPIVTGDGTTTIMIGADAHASLDACTATQLIRTRHCDTLKGTLKVVVMDAAELPHITRNIRLAWQGGSPSLLHRDSPSQDANRAAACRGFTSTQQDGSCEEYPFATTREGGPGARTDEAPLAEQHRQGGALSAGYKQAGIDNGDQFAVIITHPNKIASAPYTGR